MNPFLAGPPVSGDQFGDREAETRYLLSRLRSGQNVFLTSPRRYGKTSLLLRAAAEARAAGVRIGFANLIYCTTRQEVAEELTRAVVDRTLGWLEGSVQQVRDRLGRLPGVVPVLERDGWRLSLSATPGRSTWLEEIRRPVTLLDEVRVDGHQAALVIDEFQQVAAIDPGLAGVFKGLCDDLPGTALVFSGSRQHVLSELFAGAGAPLQNVAEPMSLEVIPEGPMVAFLRRRTTAAGRELLPQAARLLYRTMRGVPHFVQLLAASTFDREEEPLGEAAVAAALVQVLRRQQGELASRYEAMSRVQQRLVRALAQAPEPQPFAHAFAQRSRLSTPTIQRAMASLRLAETVQFDPAAGWRLTDPVFDRWLLVGDAIDTGREIDPAELLR
ncbi:MAG: hypothetical protein WAM30_01500 [Candidatus Dormiibacterota bacterium]